MTNLLESPELIPSQVQKILDQLSEGADYNRLNEINTQLNKIGFEIDYGLDAEVTELRELDVFEFTKISFNRIAVVEKYYKEDAEDLKQRAENLLDQIIEKARVNKVAEAALANWITGEGSTILLKDILHSYTDYKGNGNTPEQLRDFNAFTLLDMVKLHLND